MEIVETSIEDLTSIIELVNNVAQLDILPHFNEEGKNTFSSKVLPDVETTFNNIDYQSLKIIENEKLIGFGAIRDGHYITHLFINKSSQGLGLGKLLLSHLIALSTSNNIDLKASVNSVSFYENNGFKPTGLESMLNGIRFVPMRKLCT